MTPPGTISWNFEVKLSALKNLWWIPILVATCNICKNRLVHWCCLSGYCEKYHAQNMEFWSSVAVKKALSLDLAWVRIWKTEFDSGVLLKAFYSFGNFKKIFWVSFYDKFAGFFRKWWGKYLSKQCLIKRNCSWRDKLFVLWALNRRAKIFLRTA